jgi:DNA-binding NarL/FixJ family response regulator
VLVIDDSKFVRVSLVRLLTPHFKLVEADSGDRGWDTLLLDQNIDAVVSDLTMPGMDGFALLTRVRASNVERIRKLPFFVLSGADDSAQRSQAQTLQADGFVVKGSGFTDLPALIKERLARPRVTAPAEALPVLEQIVEVKPASSRVSTPLPSTAASNAQQAAQARVYTPAKPTQPVTLVPAEELLPAEPIAASRDAVIAPPRVAAAARLERGESSNSIARIAEAPIPWDDARVADWMVESMPQVGAAPAHVLVRGTVLWGGGGENPRITLSVLVERLRPTDALLVEDGEHFWCLLGVSQPDAAARVSLRLALALAGLRMSDAALLAQLGVSFSLTPLPKRGPSSEVAKVARLLMVPPKAGAAIMSSPKWRCALPWGAARALSI